MKDKEVIVYKQGGNWIANDMGYEYQLHYSIKTRKDVLAYFKDEAENAHCQIKVTFAK